MADFVVTQGRIVLLRTGERKYAPSLINRVNEDGSVNLTVFEPNGTVSPANKVSEGDQVGNWCQPGVDSQEKIAADARAKMAAESAGVAKPVESASQQSSPILTRSKK